MQLNESDKALNCLSLNWPEHNVSMVFRRIPAGSFKMGSRGYSPIEEPKHRVMITEDFWLGETPVTQEQFALWTESEKIEHKNRFAGRPECPAESMTWHEARRYCEWLTRIKSREFAASELIAMLPTEAQWEYACRAGTETEYSSGDGEAALDSVANYNSDSTTSVKRFEPNLFGLYDMHGNVFEWCRDTWAWDENAYRKRLDGVCDPLVLDAKYPGRVLRGGSWDNSAFGCRSAYRVGYGADNRIRRNGFRVCLVRSPAASRGA